MATNIHFSQKVRSEQLLYEDIVIESLKMYGQDVYYLPRSITGEDKILGEDVASRFGSAYKIEMYIENTDGFDGEGDLFTRFGIEIRDQASFVVSRRRWIQIARRDDNALNELRPHEGDLIYLPLSNSLFEIMHVEHENPFYQLSHLPTFKLRCELFEYADEDMDTGINAIDSIEDQSYGVILTLANNADEVGTNPDFLPGEFIEHELASGSIITADVVAYNSDTNKLRVTNLSHDSADVWAEFESGGTILNYRPDGTITRTIASLTEDFGNNNYQMNDEFDTSNSVYDFLDFSEANPFGDPEDT